MTIELLNELSQMFGLPELGDAALYLDEEGDIEACLLVDTRGARYSAYAKPVCVEHNLLRNGPQRKLT